MEHSLPIKFVQFILCEKLLMVFTGVENQELQRETSTKSAEEHYLENSLHGEN